MIDNPAGLPQEEADKIAHELIEGFISSLNNDTDIILHKSYSAISDEFRNLKKPNSKEDQNMIDTRLSVIFEETATLIDEFGERLFK